MGTMYGDLGELRVGPRRAVALRRWSFVIDQSTIGKLTVHGTASVEHVDDFLSTQGPLDLWLWMGDAWWTWKGVTVSGDMIPRSVIDIRVEGNPVANIQHSPY